jgi:hypothetical protein
MLILDWLIYTTHHLKFLSQNNSVFIMTSVSKSRKSVSRNLTIAILFFLTITIGLLIFAYVNGYFGTSNQTQNPLKIQSTAQLNGALHVYLKNIGKNSIYIDTPPNGIIRVYLNDQIWNNFHCSPVIIAEGEVSDVILAGLDESYVGKNVTIKIKSVYGDEAQAYVKIVEDAIKESFQVAFLTSGGGSGSTCTPEGVHTYKAGDTVAITARPDQNYTFGSWITTKTITVQNASKPSTTAKINGNGTITATFMYTPPQYLVRFSSYNGGNESTTTPSGTQAFAMGAVINVTASAGEGYYFGSWSVTGNITLSDANSEGTRATINGPGTIRANYVLTPTYWVYFSQVGGGPQSVATPESSQRYPYGTVVPVNAAPGLDYAFTNWTTIGNIVIQDQVDPSTTATVYGTGYVFANFRSANYTVSASTTGSGSVILTPPGGNYRPGTAVVIEAVPEEGWVFNSWGGYLNSTVGRVTVIVNERIVVTARFLQVPKSLTVNFVGSGSGVVNDGSINHSHSYTQQYAHGSNVGLFASADVDSIFIQWIGFAVGQNTISVTMDEDVTLYVNFDVRTFTVTSVVFGNGTVDPSGPQVVVYGSTPVFVFNPDPGYHVSNVTVDGSLVLLTNSSYTFPPVNAPHKIEVHYVPGVFMITPSVLEGNGVIEPSTPLTVNYGDTPTFNFIPDAGYQVELLIIDDISKTYSSNQYTFDPITSNHTIRVKFSIITYVISPSVVGGNGSTNPSSPFTVNWGGTPTITFNPEVGYHISDLTVDDSTVTTSGNTYLFPPVFANHTIKVTFAINTYTIIPTFEGEGNINPNSQQTVNYGSNLRFTFTPNVGNRIIDVLVDGISQGTLNNYSFNNVTENHNIQVIFAINTYTITHSVTGEGSITPSSPYLVNYGDNVTFTIVPNPGYHIAVVLVDGITYGVISSYTFINVIENHTMHATFDVSTYMITPAVNGGHGSINPSTPQAVNYGDTLTFSFTPDEGYHVRDVVVDSLYLGPILSYTFKNIQADHVIIVTFEINTYTITPSSSHGGQINPSTPQIVEYNTNITFTFIPDKNYMVSYLRIDGVRINYSMNAYTFNNVDANRDITVYYVRK